MNPLRWLRRLFSAHRVHGPVPWTTPPWAEFFSAEEYEEFFNLVTRYFRKSGLAFTVKDGVVQLAAAGDQEECHLGLQNLAQVCHRNQRSAWPAIVSAHFDGMQKLGRENAALDARLADFSRVAELLAIRIWPRSFLDSVSPEHILYREDLEGTVSVLVYDLPSSLKNVHPRETETWNKSPEELFEIALKNVHENCIPNVHVEDLGNNVHVTLLSDESFLTASHALMLEQHPSVIGTHGTLVGVPHRHALLCFPIEDQRVIQAVNMMIPIVYGMEREGPGSISPFLYWYRDGIYTALPYEVIEKELHFYPPDDFMKLLNELAGDEDNPDSGDEWKQ